MSKHYRTNKKEYYINLSSGDATILQKGSSTNFIYGYEWRNIKLNQNLSRNAKIGIVGAFSSITLTSSITIRCQQVKNEQYESGGNLGAIIYVDVGLKTPPFEKLYPLGVENLDSIILFINTHNNVKDQGVFNTATFLIQLKVVDYDTEEVPTELMPTYTKDSTSINYKI